MDTVIANWSHIDKRVPTCKKPPTPHLVPCVRWNECACILAGTVESSVGVVFLTSSWVSTTCNAWC